MKTLDAIISEIADFGNWNHAKKILLFAWFLHHEKGLEYFKQADIKRCFDVLHIEPPANIGPFLESLTKQKPKKALRTAKGYKLVMQAREEMALYGETKGEREISDILRTLPSKMPSLNEKIFLEECLLCFRVKAYRSSVIMAWCLAYDHLCNHITAKQLAAFNARWLLTYPGQHKNQTRVIGIREDFNRELKESEVIEIAKDARIITTDQSKILKSKLDRRNSAAHPSSVDIQQLQAEELIDDLVKNIILKLV